MKEINTTRFGDIEIDEEKIIHFKNGIPAFEDEHEFVLIPYGDDSPFLFLQSINTADLAFAMVNPFAFFSDYEFTIDDEILEDMDIKEQSDLLIFAFLTIPSGDIKKTTANLLAPIVINQRTFGAKQLILENTDYTTKHSLGENTEDSE